MPGDVPALFDALDQLIQEAAAEAAVSFSGFQGDVSEVLETHPLRSLASFDWEAGEIDEAFGGLDELLGNLEGILGIPNRAAAQNLDGPWAIYGRDDVESLDETNAPTRACGVEGPQSGYAWEPRRAPCPTRKGGRFER